MLPTAGCSIPVPLQDFPPHRLAACSIARGCVPARVPATHRVPLPQPRCVLRGCSLFLGQAQAATWKQPLDFMGASARRSQLAARVGTGQNTGQNPPSPASLLLALLRSQHTRAAEFSYTRTATTQHKSSPSPLVYIPTAARKPDESLLQKACSPRAARSREGGLGS